MSIFDALLTHTYTRTPVTEGSEDSWGVKDDSPGNATTGVVCFYNPSETLRLNEQGSVTLRGPVLLVKSDDPLNVGDRVSTVACGGSTVEAGPLTVDVVDALTLDAGVEIKRARLRRAVPR